MGLRRGKSDKADAFEIASYAWLRRDVLIPSVPPAKNLLELQRMMALRDQLVKQLTACKNLNSGMQEITANRSKDVSLVLLAKSMRHLEKQIKAIEKAMDGLIGQD